METYDPNQRPDIDSWNEVQVGDRIDRIVECHRRLGLEGLDGAERLHALTHLVVENLVAREGETPVAATVDRLIDEGSARHAALHAVGSALVLESEVWKGIENVRSPERVAEVASRAEELASEAIESGRLERVTAERWRAVARVVEASRRASQKLVVEREADSERAQSWGRTVRGVGWSFGRALLPIAVLAVGVGTTFTWIHAAVVAVALLVGLAKVNSIVNDGLDGVRGLGRATKGLDLAYGASSSFAVPRLRAILQADFILYLRSFGPEGVVQSESGKIRVREPEDTLSRALSADRPVVRIANRRADVSGSSRMARLYVEDRRWRTVVSDLVDLADSVVVGATRLTPGLEFEVDLIGRSGVHEKTVALCPNSRVAQALRDLGLIHVLEVTGLATACDRPWDDGHICPEHTPLPVCLELFETSEMRAVLDSDRCIEELGEVEI